MNSVTRTPFYLGVCFGESFVKRPFCGFPQFPTVNGRNPTYRLVRPTQRQEGACAGLLSIAPLGLGTRVSWEHALIQAVQNFFRKQLPVKGIPVAWELFGKKKA